MSVTISVRLPDELAMQLKTIAKETERSKSFFIQKALSNYFAEQAHLQVSLDRLRNSAETSLTMDEIKGNFEV